MLVLNHKYQVLMILVAYGIEMELLQKILKEQVGFRFLMIYQVKLQKFQCVQMDYSTLLPKTKSYSSDKKLQLMFLLKIILQHSLLLKEWEHLGLNKQLCHKLLMQVVVKTDKCGQFLAVKQKDVLVKLLKILSVKRCKHKLLVITN